MIREEIENLIRKACLEVKLPIDKVKFSIEQPEQEKYGDYSTNLAMQLAKVVKKSPMEVAKVINFQSSIFEKVEIAGPGFINFFISKDYLQNQVKEILKKGEKFGDLNIGKNKKIQVEFISANPTGPLTIGNSRAGPFGDVLANIFKKASYKVEKEYYVNDFGNQILALGHSVLKNKEAVYHGDYINQLHQQIKEKDPFRVGQKAAKIIINEMIKKTIKRMGINYDKWFFESELHKSGEVDKVIESLKKKKLVYEKEGALWLKSSKYGDNRDRVLVKKDSFKTYLAGDIAYHRNKFEKRKFNKVINIWGADHHGDVAGLKAGVEALGHKNKLEIILHQFVTVLQKGKKIRMSKRKGIYFTMDELIDEVGIDVVRFFFLQKSIDSHLNFDLDLAKEQSEKNPVYYVQYAYARINSILAKIPKSKIQIPNKSQIPKSKFSLLNHQSELKLIKQLIRFPEIIEDTAKDYQVQRLPQYALDLATVFHQFYRDCRVLRSPEGAKEDRVVGEELSNARLALVLATKTVLKNTFDLMGISAPQKM